MGRGGCTTTLAVTPAEQPSDDQQMVRSADVDSKDCNAENPSLRSWWCRGGMHVNEIGMGLVVFIPPAVLASALEKQQVQMFVAAVALHCILAFTVFHMRTMYCVLIVPVYMSSLFLLPALKYPILCGFLGVHLAVCKVAVNMSVCYHRYASHAAFKCEKGSLTQFLVCVCGCLCNQGGPIWWASQHRLHHKHCDLPRDPHSATLDGTEAAFSFFLKHVAVEEEFAPGHIDTFWIRLLDTWSFVVVGTELILAYTFLGHEGLSVFYLSAWLCQMVTLWFNVVNHPAQKEGTCKAVDKKYRGASPNWYPAWILLDALTPIYVTFTGEDEHEVHHEHFSLAKRGPYDLAYYSSIWPMKKLGLIWDVKGYHPE